MSIQQRDEYDFERVEFTYEEKNRNFLTMLTLMIADATPSEQDITKDDTERIRVYFEQKNYPSEPKSSVDTSSSIIRL